MKQFHKVLLTVVAGTLAILVFATMVHCQVLYTPTEAQTYNDGAPITVGLRFTPKADVSLTGIRFWKEFGGEVTGTGTTLITFMYDGTDFYFSFSTYSAT